MSKALLNSQFITATLGSTSVQWLTNFKSLQIFLLTFYFPVVTSITFLLNFLVFILCIVIYLKTKKINHKTAFLCIGILAFFDMLMGR